MNIESENINQGFIPHIAKIKEQANKLEDFNVYSQIFNGEKILKARDDMEKLLMIKDEEIVKDILQNDEVFRKYTNFLQEIQ
mmetsp:Transcript_26484/g.19845  ORF Transcript_26484/g.19845 Transcript_26484/m.19845 type:complete len:82 (-) Transcript_26484:2474-2719(-)